MTLTWQIWDLRKDFFLGRQPKVEESYRIEAICGADTFLTTRRQSSAANEEVAAFFSDSPPHKPLNA